MRRDGPAVLVSSPVTLLFSELNNHQDAPGSRFSSGGPSVYPGVLSETTAGLNLPGGFVDDMTGRRIAVSEETYKALQAEGLVCGESQGDVLARLVEGGISQKAREVLRTIGQPSATVKGKKGNLATKQPARRGALLDNGSRKQQLIDMVRAGDITLEEMGSRLGGYDKGAVSRAIQKLKAAGEISEEEEGGEESTD